MYFKSPGCRLCCERLKGQIIMKILFFLFSLISDFCFDTSNTTPTPPIRTFSKHKVSIALTALSGLGK